jgi:hypothetical protein
MNATLIISAGNIDDRQILLASAGALGSSIVTILGGGSSLLVQLSE